MESVKRYGLYTMKDKISEVGPVAESRIIGLRAGVRIYQNPFVKAVLLLSESKRCQKCNNIANSLKK